MRRRHRWNCRQNRAGNARWATQSHIGTLLTRQRETQTLPLTGLRQAIGRLGPFPTPRLVCSSSILQISGTCAADCTLYNQRPSLMPLKVPTPNFTTTRLAYSVTVYKSSSGIPPRLNLLQAKACCVLLSNASARAQLVHSTRSWWA